jgi:hypothetical protein
MATFFKRRSAYFWCGAAFVVLLLVSAPLVRPVAAASDNTNLIQQILAIVERIDTAVAGLTGLGGSFSTLQADVTTIKAKTSNLPDNTAAVLTEISGNVGSPLTRMFMASFTVSQGQTGSMTCTSSGPFLLHVHGHGIHADIAAQLNTSTFQTVLMPVPVNFVLGGNASDAFTLTFVVANVSNPNAYGTAFVTMQTTQGSVVGCN